MAYNSTTWTTGASTTSVSSTNLTLYAYFGAGSGTMANVSTGTHVALPFGYSNTSSLADNFELGTSTDPSTSFTTADGSNTDASIVVPCLWYLPDNIYIDEIVSIEGAENSATEATRMHLMSYTFTSGSTSCLTSGAVIAYNADVTNAGSEQAYKSTWTIDTPSVAASKVLVATWRQDDAANDFSTNIIIKYHLT